MEITETKIMEVENKLAYVLAVVYNKTVWNKINTRNTHTFFINRVRASATTRNFKEFLDVLCKKMNIEFLQLETSIMNFLTEYEGITLSLIRKETQYIVNFALEIKEDVRKGEYSYGNN